MDRTQLRKFERCVTGVLSSIRRVDSVASAAKLISELAAAQPGPPSPLLVISEPFYAASEMLNPWVAAFRVLRDLESLREALTADAGDGTGAAATRGRALMDVLVRPERGILYAQLASAPRLWASRRAVSDVHGEPRLHLYPRARAKAPPVEHWRWCT